MQACTERQCNKFSPLLLLSFRFRGRILLATATSFLLLFSNFGREILFSDLEFLPFPEIAISTVFPFDFFSSHSFSSFVDDFLLRRQKKRAENQEHGLHISCHLFLQAMRGWREGYMTSSSLLVPGVNFSLCFCRRRHRHPPQDANTFTSQVILSPETIHLLPASPFLLPSFPTPYTTSSFFSFLWPWTAPSGH